MNYDNTPRIIQTLEGCSGAGKAMARILRASEKFTIPPELSVVKEGFNFREEMALYLQLPFPRTTIQMRLTDRRGYKALVFAKLDPEIAAILDSGEWTVAREEGSPVVEPGHFARLAREDDEWVVQAMVESAEGMESLGIIGFVLFRNVGIRLKDTASGQAEFDIKPSDAKFYTAVYPALVMVAATAIKHGKRPQDVGNEIMAMLAKALTMSLSALMEMSMLLSCKNVRQISHEPDAALNRKRMRDGKEPFSVTRTLELGVNEDGSGGDSLGDGSGVRFHLRRGHIRRLPTGRNTWVRNTTVGNPGLGSVKKDYNVRAGA